LLATCRRTPPGLSSRTKVFQASLAVERCPVRVVVPEFSIYNFQFHFFNRSPTTSLTTCRRSAACRVRRRARDLGLIPEAGNGHRSAVVRSSRSTQPVAERRQLLATCRRTPPGLSPRTKVFQANLVAERFPVRVVVPEFSIYNFQFHFFNRSPTTSLATCRRSAACRVRGRGPRPRFETRGWQLSPLRGYSINRIHSSSRGATTAESLGFSTQGHTPKTDNS
jgi:hypothetical protein